MKGHRPGLDGIRALAIGLVMLSHFAPALDPLLPGGNIGVRVFFVLSGFLITGILLREGGDRDRLSILAPFYIRRALRILPVYFIAVFGIAYAFNIDGARDLWPWLASFTFNWHMIEVGSGTGNLSPYWSIAVEEQFYLIWPWLLFLWPSRYLALICPAFVVGGMAFRLIGALSGADPDALYLSTFGAVDALALGGWLATGRLAGVLRAGSVIGGLAFLALYATKALVGLSDLTGQVYDMSAAWGAVWLIGAATKPGWLASALSTELAQYVGQLSYSLYVYHMLVYALVARWLSAAGIPWDAYEGPRIIALFALSFILSAASFHLIEKPINALKARFPYRSRTRAPVPLAEQRPAPLAAPGQPKPERR